MLEKCGDGAMRLLLLLLSCFAPGWALQLPSRRRSAGQGRLNSASDSFTTSSSSMGAPSDYQGVGRNPVNGAYNFGLWSKAFLSQTDQFDYYVDASSIEGTIPAGLSGSLIRNMPALFERGGKDYGHYLDGTVTLQSSSFSQMARSVSNPNLFRQASLSVRKRPTKRFIVQRFGRRENHGLSTYPEQVPST